MQGEVVVGSGAPCDFDRTMRGTPAVVEVQLPR
jgi:hypothetical protein